MCIAAYDLLGRLNILGVLLTRDALLAYTATLADVVLQTHLVFAAFYTLGRHRCITGTQRVERVNKVEHRICRVAETIRPEVLRSAAFLLAGLEYTRISLTCDADIRIALTVLEQDIIVRLILLDQVVLQQKRILFAADHHILDVRNMRHKLACLERGLVLTEVTAHAPLEVLGLTHIDHCSLTIEVLIYARLLGYTLQQGGDMLVFGGHRRSTIRPPRYSSGNRHPRRAWPGTRGR